MNSVQTIMYLLFLLWAMIFVPCIVIGALIYLGVLLFRFVNWWSKALLVFFPPKE